MAMPQRRLTRKTDPGSNICFFGPRKPYMAILEDVVDFDEAWECFLVARHGRGTYASGWRNYQNQWARYPIMSDGAPTIVLPHHSNLGQWEAATSMSEAAMERFERRWQATHLLLLKHFCSSQRLDAQSTWDRIKELMDRLNFHNTSTKEWQKRVWEGLCVCHYRKRCADGNFVEGCLQMVAHPDLCHYIFPGSPGVPRIFPGSI